MALNQQQKSYIEDVLKNSLRNKFQNYNPEPAIMPFHTRLLGGDRLALYSFIQSLITTFGTSIFEPIGKSLGEINFEEAQTQYTVGNQISDSAQRVIQQIIDNLTTAQNTPNKTEEILAIRNVCHEGSMITVKPTKIDLMLKTENNEYYLFDIKTAKPNSGEFKGFKRTLLEWVAIFLATNPDADINTLLAIPYNPYEPEPYNRWTMRGMIDLPNELKVASEFWDFLGGEGAYQDLLDCFERVGIELRDEIDEYFRRFNNINV